MTTPASIRTAASLLIIAPTNHILFMLRPSSGSFPSTHVFPGGSFDPETDPSLSYTALRETYEETGLLLGPCRVPASSFLNAKPSASSSEKVKVNPVVHAVGEYPSYDSAFKHVFNLSPLSLKTPAAPPDSVNWWTEENEQSILGLDRISNWTTPVHLPKRFATQFFVYKVPQVYQFPELPPISSAPPSSDGTPAGNVQGPEVEKLEWLTPFEAIQKFREGHIKLMPPQFYLMTAILENGIDKAVQKLKNRVIKPKIVETYPSPEGTKKVKMDWGEGEAGIITFGKNGVVDDMSILEKSKL